MICTSLLHYQDAAYEIVKSDWLIPAQVPSSREIRLACHIGYTVSLLKFAQTLQKVWANNCVRPQRLAVSTGLVFFNLFAAMPGGGLSGLRGFQLGIGEV